MTPKEDILDAIMHRGSEYVASAKTCKRIWDGIAGQADLEETASFEAAVCSLAHLEEEEDAPK